MEKACLNPLILEALERNTAIQLRAVQCRTYDFKGLHRILALARALHSYPSLAVGGTKRRRVVTVIGWQWRSETKHTERDS
jgi:hypothetical protein